MKPGRHSLFDPPTPVIDGKTKVRLVVVLAIMSPLVAACFFMAGLTWQIKELRNDVRSLRIGMQSQWTVTDQMLFAAKWQSVYPNQPMPDVQAIVNLRPMFQTP